MFVEEYRNICSDAGDIVDILHVAMEQVFELIHSRLFFGMIAEKRQDKVNYAVSERDDRVTGATTLTRMAGCNGMYPAATVLC